MAKTHIDPHGYPTAQDFNPDPPNDPWQHRSARMLCTTCMWYVVKESSTPVVKALGRCRRRAPTMNGFPAVFGADWCGDHKLDENKI